MKSNVVKEYVVSALLDIGAVSSKTNIGNTKDPGLTGIFNNLKEGVLYERENGYDVHV